MPFETIMQDIYVEPAPSLGSPNLTEMDLRGANMILLFIILNIHKRITLNSIYILISSYSNLKQYSFYVYKTNQSCLSRFEPVSLYFHHSSKYFLFNFIIIMNINLS